MEGGGGRGRGRGSPRPTEGRAVGGASGPRGSSGESRGVKGRDLPAPSSRPAAPRVALIRPTARAHVSARARMSPRGAPRGAKAGRGRLRLVGASALNTNKPFSTALPPSPPGTPTWKGLVLHAGATAVGAAAPFLWGLRRSGTPKYFLLKKPVMTVTITFVPASNLRERNGGRRGV